MPGITPTTSRGLASPLSGSFWIACFSTRHFDFKGYGSTEAEANEALVRGLTKHGDEYGLAPEWWQSFDIHGEGYATEIRLGACFRDGQEIA